MKDESMSDRAKLSNEIDDKLAAIDQELVTLEHQKKKRIKRGTELNKRFLKLREQIQRRERQKHFVMRLKDLSPLVGKPDGVQLACRTSDKRLQKFNDTKGTLLEIRRSRLTVDFGGEKWNMALDEVRPAGALQGYELQ